VLFFEARYFYFLAGLPLVVVALGLPDLPRAAAAMALAAVLGVNGWFALDSHSRMRAQERSVSLLHTLPASDFAELLPADARIFVEGAGATRFLAARETEVIDALGLNRGEVAHAPDDLAKACVLVNARPTHALLPDHIAGPLSRVFRWTQLRAYLDPDNAMVRERHPMQVRLYQIDGVAPDFEARCNTP
jgi:hypothetical protein